MPHQKQTSELEGVLEEAEQKNLLGSKRSLLSLQPKSMPYEIKK
jgi:hypothetical protein